MFNLETYRETEKRLLKLNKYKDDESVVPALSAQTALNELCRFFLGQDYCIVDPVNNEQGNFIIVKDIERKYKHLCKKGKHFKNS